MYRTKRLYAGLLASLILTIAMAALAPRVARERASGSPGRQHRGGPWHDHGQRVSHRRVRRRKWKPRSLCRLVIEGFLFEDAPSLLRGLRPTIGRRPHCSRWWR